MEKLTVRTVTLDLEGGQRLRVSRYTEPGSGRSVLTLSRTWQEDPVDFPTRGPHVLTLPADCTGALVEALQELGGA